ncbi:MAG: sigma-70 family RNA polymerase sigma factor [Tannerella sp.]|jgi:RNA polymerase sigma-70 factor (ECF subfamily)|nr:sigma-70 family RNA polymerase sigma factor [Tannerella sp.]
MDIKHDDIYQADTNGFLTSIYNTFAKDMYRYGLALCADECLVEDAIHDLMVDFCRHRDNLLNARNVKVYLFQALRYRILLLQKNNGMYSNFDEETDFSALDPVQDVETLYIEEEEESDKKMLVEMMMSRLNIRQKELLYLRFTEALPFDEIAAMMNINRQSVQNLFQRVINKLKKEFAKNEKVF